jgi:hypothetical protein
VRANAELVGAGRFSGVVPLAIPGDISGSFLLDMRAAGFLDQRVRVVFPGGAGPLTWDSPRPTDTAGVAKALAWPGLAEITGDAGDAYRGVCFATAGGTGMIGLLAAAIRQGQAEDDRTAALDETGETPAARASLALAAAEHGAAADAANEAVHDWLFFSAAIWGTSILDTYLLTPGPGQVTADLTELDFEMKPLSRHQALARSLVPGLGQFYSGRRSAGQIAFAAGLVAMTGLLMAEHSYDEAVHTVAAYEALYDDPLADPEQVAAYRTALEDAVDTADSRQTTRNVMAGITAAVWIANLADAYFGTLSAGDRSEARETTGAAPGLHLRGLSPAGVPGGSHVGLSLVLGF